MQDRVTQLPYIAAFCKQAGMGDERISQLMGYLGKVLIKEGMIEKTADVKADPELISSDLNARVINGTHPLEIVVQTIVDKDNEAERLRGRTDNPIKTRLDVYKATGAVLDQKVKEL